MRPFSLFTALLCANLALSSPTPPQLAHRAPDPQHAPPQRDPPLPLLLERRQQVCGAGATPCGYNALICCAAGSTCYTDAANQAQCSTLPAGGVLTVVTVTTTSGFTTVTPAVGGVQGEVNTITTSSVVVVVTTLTNGAAATTTAAGSTGGSGSSAATSGGLNTGSQNMDTGSIIGIVVGVVLGIIVMVWMCQPIMRGRGKR